MKNNDVPEYLYHYTSIENLALILKNRTIRLNPLDTMDDLQEAKTADIKNFGQFIFVSSWTSDEQESIPMWKMYTNPSSGVRIKLPSNPFKWYRTSGNKIPCPEYTMLYDSVINDNSFNTFLDLAELKNINVICLQAFDGKILKPISYVEDKELLEPQVLQKNHGIKLLMDKMGRYKNTGWSFQKEWRYIMTFIPFDHQKDMNKKIYSYVQILSQITKGICNLPIRHFDLNIEDEKFKKMEITVSPQLTPGNQVVLETLVEKYNPSAKIVQSKYKGLL